MERRCAAPMQNRVSSISWANHKRQYLSEMLGTYLLVFFGPGSVVTASLLGLTAIEGLLFVAAVFGTTVAAVIVVLGRFSGAHINPAISVGSALAGLLERKLFLPYALFQILGGLLAGLTLRVVFFSEISSTNLGSTQLAAGITPLQGVVLEIAGTFILAIAALTAGSFIRTAAGQAILVGGTLFVLIIFIGPLTGASFNPARSLGPSFFSGYMSGQLVYYIGPIVGAAGAGVVFGAVKESYDSRKKATNGRRSSNVVLFVCVENAGRSQMAEGFARRLGLNALSAGTLPSSKVNPIVVQALKEKGIDLASNKPKNLTSEMIENASLVVTMGCSVEEACPRPMLAQMQKKLVDWNLPDPKGKPIEEVRTIRDEIERRVSELSKTPREASKP